MRVAAATMLVREYKHGYLDDSLVFLLLHGGVKRPKSQLEHTHLNLDTVS